MEDGMTAYESSEQLFEWCKIPPEDLTSDPRAKVKLRILPTSRAVHEDIANTMIG
jgi:hypothetical protein